MINHHVTIRRATNLDLDRIVACDPIAATDPRRAAFLAARVGDGECCVYESGHDILGFIILEYTFYEHGFVSLLCVHEGARRHGVGRALMHHSLLSCSTPKLFTSTNQSNGPMRALLAACGALPRDRFERSATGLDAGLAAGDRCACCAVILSI